MSLDSSDDNADRSRPRSRTVQGDRVGPKLTDDESSQNHTLTI